MLRNSPGSISRELNPKQRVVVRLADTHLAQTLREAANVRLALSTSALAAPAFFAALYGDRVQNIFLIEGQVLAVLDVPETVAVEETMRDMIVQDNATVLARNIKDALHAINVRTLFREQWAEPVI